MLNAQAHASTRTSTARKDAVDGSGGSSSSRVSAETNWNKNAENDDMLDVDDVSQQHTSHSHTDKEVETTDPRLANISNAVVSSDKEEENGVLSVEMQAVVVPGDGSVVPVDAPAAPVSEKNVSSRLREVTVTGSLVPSVSVFSHVPDVLFSSPSSTVVHVDVDFDHLKKNVELLKSRPSNNKKKMLDEMIKATEEYKKVTGKTISFSPREIMKGLDIGKIQQKEASRQTKDRAKEMKEREQEQKIPDAAPSSIAPAPLSVPFVQTPSHTFILHFDTITNATNGISLLTSLGRYAYHPPAPSVIGRVYGIKFNTTLYERQAYLDKYAKEVPSLSLVCVKHAADDSMFREYMYFKFAKSELQQALILPHMNGRNRLRFEEFKRPTMRCSHCFKSGHVTKDCKHIQTENKAGGRVRGACCGCLSFDHVIASCPVASKKEYACPLCHAGKHTARSCPLYRGKYVQLHPDKYVNEYDHVNDTNPKTGTQSAWSRPLRTAYNNEVTDSSYPRLPGSSVPTTSVVHVPSASVFAPPSPPPSEYQELHKVIKLLSDRILQLEKALISKEQKKKKKNNDTEMKEWIGTAIAMAMSQQTNTTHAMIMAERERYSRIAPKEGDVVIGHGHDHVHDNTSLIARTTEAKEQTRTSLADVHVMSSQAITATSMSASKPSDLGSSKRPSRSIDPSQPSIVTSLAHAMRSSVTSTTTTPTRASTSVPSSSLSSLLTNNINTPKRGGLKYYDDDEGTSKDGKDTAQTETGTTTTTNKTSPEQESETVDMTMTESEHETDTGDGGEDEEKKGKEKENEEQDTDKKYDHAKPTPTGQNDKDDYVFSDTEQATSTEPESTEQEQTDITDGEQRNTEQSTSDHEDKARNAIGSVSFPPSGSRFNKRTREPSVSPDKPDDVRVRAPRSKKGKGSKFYNGGKKRVKRGKKGMGKDGKEEGTEENIEMEDDNTNKNDTHDAADDAEESDE